MRRHVAAHQRVWAAIAIVVVIANELVDRNFFDHREHIDGDILITVVALVIAISVSYAVSRLKNRRLPAQ